MAVATRGSTAARTPAKAPPAATGKGVAALEVESAAAAALPSDDDATTTSNGQAAAPSSAATAMIGAAWCAAWSSRDAPLVVASDGAFRALLVGPLVAWWLCIGAGMWAYQGLPHGAKVSHALTWFDRGVLRPAGPLVPFAVVLARAAAHLAARLLAAAAAAASPSSSGRGGGGGRSSARGRGAQHGGGGGGASPQLRLGALLLQCLAVYAVMAAARVAVYLVHVALLARRVLDAHVVSDHIFLAATMLICLHAEVLCLVSDLLRTNALPGALGLGAGRPAGRNSAAAAAGGGGGGSVAARAHAAMLLALLAVALALYGFTAADMFYTARYFHFPLESFVTTVVVFFAFQLPVLLWLTRQRRVR